MKFSTNKSVSEFVFVQDIVMLVVNDAHSYVLLNGTSDGNFIRIRSPENRFIWKLISKVYMFTSLAVVDVGVTLNYGMAAVWFIVTTIPVLRYSCL